MKLCIPVNDPRGLESSVCMHFGSAPFFMFVETDDRSCEAVPNGNQHHEHGSCSPLAVVTGREVGAMVVGGIGRGALGALMSAGLTVYRACGPTVASVVDGLEKGLLQRMNPASACAGHDHGHGDGHNHRHDP